MRILIALGGNAILKENEKGTFSEQQRNITGTARQITKVIKHGHDVVITHGNGPQVGDILLRYELSKKQLPVMPLHVCGGESQGMIGYMIEQAIAAELKRAGIKRDVACVLTRTVVSKNDPNIRNPSKPIGPFYSRKEAERLAKEYKWRLVLEDNKYRRVVPSPIPIEIVELDSIRRLVSNGKIVVCTGGGGVPVVRNGNSMNGIDAVIDKDLASSLLARKLNVDLFLILTNVGCVFLNYGKRKQERIERMDVLQCKRYLDSDQFEKGTMRPKVKAAMDFAKSTGKRAVIAALEDADIAVNGKAGTEIVK